MKPAGVPMVQPDIVKMGGITGMLRCAALAQAHGAEFVPQQTQPTIGHMVNLHLAATQLHKVLGVIGNLLYPFGQPIERYARAQHD